MVQIKAFLANPKHQYYVSERGELDCSAHNEKNVDFYEYRSQPISHMNINYKRKWWKKKLFFPNQSINILYPNDEMLIVLDHKKNGYCYKNPSLAYLTYELLLKRKW